MALKFTSSVRICLKTIYCKVLDYQNLVVNLYISVRQFKRLNSSVA